MTNTPKTPKTLRDWLPVPHEAPEKLRKKFGLKVVYESGTGWNWPGTHKNVCWWVILEDGTAVGWNENPSRGWSFPSLKLIRQPMYRVDLPGHENREYTHKEAYDLSNANSGAAVSVIPNHFRFAQLDDRFPTGFSHVASVVVPA